MIEGERYIDVVPVVAPHDGDYVRAAEAVPGVEVDIFDPTSTEDCESVLHEFAAAGADRDIREGNIREGERAEYERRFLELVREKIEANQDLVLVRIAADKPPLGYLQIDALTALARVLQAMDGRGEAA